MTPLPYISYSQMSLFEMQPKEYAAQYLHGKRGFVNKNMLYGTLVANALEVKEATGDPYLDLLLAKLPKFRLMDKIVMDDKGVKVWYKHLDKNIHIPAVMDGKKPIPIVAKPDTANTRYTKFKEYKTSVRPWTQRMADTSGQITFYAMAMWLKTGRIPTDIELIAIVVEYGDNGALRPTGEFIQHRTYRRMVDIIKMTARVKRAWKGIQDLCESELL